MRASSNTMTIDDKLKKLEEIGKLSKEMSESTDWLLGIKDALELASPDNLDKLIDRTLLTCADTASQVLSIIARRESGVEIKVEEKDG